MRLFVLHLGLAGHAPADLRDVLRHLELDDVIPGQADLQQDFLGVFAMSWRRTKSPNRFAVELSWRRCNPKLRLTVLLDLEKISVGEDLRILASLGRA